MSELSWIKSLPGGVRLQVKVLPRASRDEIIEITDDYLRVKLTAPPVEGEANKRLTKFMGKALGCSSGKIKIISGATGRNKLLEISGLTEDKIRSQVNRCCKKEYNFDHFTHTNDKLIHLRSGVDGEKEKE